MQICTYSGYVVNKFDMGQKVHPLVFRLGVNRAWSSRWFSARNFKEYLREDVLLLKWLRKRLRRAHVTDIIIERLSGGKLEITIHTARPGVLIGRGGAGIEELRNAVTEQLAQIRGGAKDRKGTREQPVRIEIQEVRNPDAHAALLAQSVAEQLERRMPFKRVIARTLERAMATKEVQGAKIQVSGRLGGAEMSRREWVRDGRVPLQTLRSDIDYALDEARTTYGVIGVKVWLYKGDIFEDGLVSRTPEKEEQRPRRAPRHRN